VGGLNHLATLLLDRWSEEAVIYTESQRRDWIQCSLMSTNSTILGAAALAVLWSVVGRSKVGCKCVPHLVEAFSLGDWSRAAVAVCSTSSSRSLTLPVALLWCGGGR